MFQRVKIDWLRRQSVSLMSLITSHYQANIFILWLVTEQLQNLLISFSFTLYLISNLHTHTLLNW